MSNANLFRLQGVPKAVLSNGLGRYIPQLQRITLKFCKSYGGSRGVREFIENDLVDFARNNQSVVVYVKPRRHKSPVIVAEYLNGERKWLSVSNFTRDDINKWLNLFVTQSGIPDKKFKILQNTQHPSIQGPWSPFTNRKPELNVTDFPNEELSRYNSGKQSATERLMEIFKEQQERESKQT